MKTISYAALALQSRCYAINSCEDTESAREKIFSNINHIAGQVRTSKMFIGNDVKLVVLPEYFLTSYPTGEPIAKWQEKACLEMQGREYDQLSKIAQDNSVYLSGNAYEIDPLFPEIYFQTSFIINDSGDIILRYRRLISMFAPTPHDIWDKYLENYSLEEVFPVVETPLGNLACVASEEILYPELSRALAFNGAEVILHSSSEVGSNQLTPKDIGKRARASENMAYVISANSAGIDDLPFPAESTDGMSKIVDYKGRVTAEAGFGETMVANDEINIQALRRYRNKTGMGNLLARQRFELFASLYQQTVYPANSLLDSNGSLKSFQRNHFTDTQADTINKLNEMGVIEDE